MQGQPELPLNWRTALNLQEHQDQALPRFKRAAEVLLAAETHRNLPAVIDVGALSYIAHEAVQAIHCRIAEPLKCLRRHFVALLCHATLRFENSRLSFSRTTAYQPRIKI